MIKESHRNIKKAFDVFTESSMNFTKTCLNYFLPLDYLFSIQDCGVMEQARTHKTE